ATGTKPEMISAHIDAQAPLTVAQGVVRDTNGNALVWFSENWKWQAEENALVCHLENQATTLAIATKPMAAPLDLPNLAAVYEGQHQQCVAVWQELLDRGAQWDVPEPLVNNAWRALVVGCFTLLKTNSINYSYGNQYERLYQAECGDSARALALFGHTEAAAKMIPPLLAYNRDRSEE